MPNTRSQRLMTFGILIALALAPFTNTDVLGADAYPSKTVRIIIPYPPGGSNDFVGRIIATQLTEKLGKPVVVDFRGGAGSMLGVEAAANSQPDGHTLLIISAAYPALSATHTKLPYDPVKSFVPIAKLATAPNALAVFPGLPVNSVKEIIALAKEKPGKLICAANGVGASQHLVSELFFMMADIDVKIVQFKGGSLMLADIIGGHSHIHFSSVTSVMPYIQSGKLKALGVGGSKRSAMLPDVPTISEAGVPGYEANILWGILAPAGTPQAIVDRLSKELRASLASADVKKLFLAQGAEVDYMGPAEFGIFLQAETDKLAKVVKKANIKVD